MHGPELGGISPDHRQRTGMGMEDRLGRVPQPLPKAAPLLGEQADLGRDQSRDLVTGIGRRERKPAGAGRRRRPASGVTDQLRLQARAA
jgi:hypothetical protein